MGGCLPCGGATNVKETGQAQPLRGAVSSNGPASSNGTATGNVRPRIRCIAPESGNLRTFNQSFARAVCIAPLIGDRHKSKEINAETMKHIADCLRAEARSLGVCTTVRSDTQGAEIDLCDLLENSSSSDMSANIIFAYTLDSFVFREVSKAARLRQEERTNLAPYVRGLHDVLLTAEGLNRFGGTTFRVMSMDETAALTYKPSSTDLRTNLFSWDGFTSAVTTAQTAYRNFQMFKASVLFIIEQGTGDYPVLVSKLSEYPAEDEVIYSLGQSFRKISYYKESAGRLWSDLGVVEGSEDVGDVIVIKILATDCFYELAQDLIRDGGVSEALPILQARLQWEKERRSPMEARAHKELAGAYVDKIQYDLAMEHYQISLEMFKRDGDPRDVAKLNTCIAYVLELQLEYEAALELHEHVRREHEALGDNDESKRAIGRTCLQMGMIHTKRGQPGDWEEALRLFQEADRLCSQYVGEESIEVATAINCTGEVYHRQQKLDEALEKFERTLQLRELILGDSHQDTAMVLMNLGGCYRDQGKNDLSLQTFERAKEVYIRALGSDTIKVADVYMQLLPIYNSAGDFSLMREKAELCHRIYMRNLGQDHPSTATAKAWMDYCSGML